MPPLYFSTIVMGRNTAVPAVMARRRLVCIYQQPGQLFAMTGWKPVFRFPQKDYRAASA
jgi:hypothetical protein